MPLAIGLTGQRLLGVPIIVQASQVSSLTNGLEKMELNVVGVSVTHHFLLPKAEKNRLAATASNLQKGSGGPVRLYVGSLHFNITEDMLRGIFEPFGKVSRKRGEPLKRVGNSGEGECTSSVWSWLTQCMFHKGHVGPSWESWLHLCILTAQEIN